MKPISVPPSAVHRVDRWRVRIDTFRTDMRGPGLIFASDRLQPALESDGTLGQVVGVATLPGLVGASMAMPDAHQGYGFPIGGVAATDPAADGVISPGGVGFDINCGVRLLATDLQVDEVRDRLRGLLEAIFRRVPVGVGQGGDKVAGRALDGALAGGARWAVEQGHGKPEDFSHCESRGAMPEADPAAVSERAKARGAGQLGSLGAGNHFIELQRVERIEHPAAAQAMGLREGQLVVLLHTGSRGLGHQVCTDQVALMQQAMKHHGLKLPDRQLACAPLHSSEGQHYLAAMAAAANYAWANRQVITQHLRRALADSFGRQAQLRVVYDLAHNIAKLETHQIDGQARLLCVHRKGATRAFAAGHPELPGRYRDVGQPVFIPGSMGTASWVLVGTPQAMAESWGSVCHGAGRAMSRTAARKTASAESVLAGLTEQGIQVQAGSKRGLSEEAPQAYKDVELVVRTVVGAGLARRVARLLPLGVVKG
jgi:tRNA-splicing ligase RtcB